MIQGIVLKVASTLVFALMSTIAKAYASDYPPAQLAFFRFFFAVPVVVAWLWQSGQFPRALKTKRLGGHLLRSISGTSSLFLTISAYSFLPLADVTVVGYAAPLMIVVLATFMLNERVSASRLAGVALGFIGVVMMLWEHLGSSDPGASRGAIGAVLALAGAFCVAVAMIQTRRLIQTEHTGAVIFYFQSTGAVISASMMLVAAIWPSSFPFARLIQSQAWIMPPLPVVLTLIMAGVFGGLGQLLMTRSFVLADASIIACFDYTSMIWVIILGIIFLQEWPTPMVLLGAAIIAMAGLMVILSERRRKPLRTA